MGTQRCRGVKTLARLVEEKRLRVKTGTRSSAPAFVNRGCTQPLQREDESPARPREKAALPRQIIRHERDRLGMTATLVGSSLPSREV